MSMTVTDLPVADYSGDLSVLTGSVGKTSRMTLGAITDAIKSELGFLKNPVTKCQHCGQWGAVYCACVKCGAPIDPEE